MAERRVFKNSLYYMVASFLPMASGFLLLPLYSFYLEPEGYGVYILAYSFMTFLVTILSMQLHGSIGRFYFDFHGADKRTYLSSLMLLLLVLSLLGTLLVDYTLDGILQWVFPNIEEKYYNIFQMAVYIAFANILTQAQMALLRVREKARLFMFISVTVFLIGVSITIVELVVLKNGVYGLILSLVVQSILSCLLFSLANYDYFTIRIRFKVLEEPVRYSIPLVPHALAGFMFMYSDKIVLEKFISLEMLGIYALADKIASAFKVNVNQFNAAYSPVFNKTAKKSKELAVELSRSMASKLMLILTIGMIVLGLTSYEFVYYLFDEKYLDAWQFLPFLATAYLFRALYCFASHGIFFDKRTVDIAKITLIAGAISLGLNILLIPMFGVWAAATVLVTSFMITFFLALYFSKKVFYVELQYPYITIMIVSVFAALMAFFVMNNWLYTSSQFDALYIVLGKILLSLAILAWLAMMIRKKGFIQG